jgi:hypothetical protein
MVLSLFAVGAHTDTLAVVQKPTRTPVSEDNSEKERRSDQEDRVELMEFKLAMGDGYSRKGRVYNRLVHKDGIAT